MLGPELNTNFRIVPRMVLPLRRLVEEGRGYKAVHSRLEKQFPDDPDLPSESTVKRYIPQYRRWLKQVMEPWSVETADAEEAKAVLEILAFIHTFSGGHKSQITKYEAQWITKIRRMRSDLPARKVWTLAWEYEVRRRNIQATLDVDLLLSLLPRLDPDRDGSVVEAHIQVRELFRRRQQEEGWPQGWDALLWIDPCEDDMLAAVAGSIAPLGAAPHIGDPKEFWQTPNYLAVMDEAARKTARWWRRAGDSPEPDKGPADA